MTVRLDDAVARLVDWDLIDAAAVVDGNFEVSSIARRNLNLRLERDRGPGLLIKQPDPAIPNGRRTLRTERAFYAFCDEESRAAPVARWMPRMWAAFANEDVLAIELVAGARPLWDEVREHGAAEPSLAPPRALGEALGTLHSTFERPEVAADSRLDGLERQPPPAFDIHLPYPSVLRRIGPAQRELTRMIQGEPAVCEALERARAGWRFPTVIHGDVRFDNVLVCDAEGARSVVLVDWELVQRGDPAFDVAGALASFARVWLLSLPLDSDLDAIERVSAARIPLAALHPLVAAFWDGYRGAAGGSGAAADDLLGRAVLFSGAVLIQSAWEYCYRAEQPSSLAVLLLQLAANILTDPTRKALDLYGLTTGEAAGRR